MPWQTSYRHTHRPNCNSHACTMTGHFSIPESLTRTRIALQGEVGAEWIRNLPKVLAYCERRWSLSTGPPFPQLSFNYAAPAKRANGTSLVVKVCYPDREFATEVQALQVYAGQGAVQLLDFDLEQGVMLLEHVKPGTLLSNVPDDAEATSIAASVMRQIWHPVPASHSFPSVADWGKGFGRLRARYDGGTGPYPLKLVEEGERLFSDLLSSMGEPVVLHGDLHHYNILSAERQPWLAIDPKGVVGEAEYETGALIRNPTPEILYRPHLDRILARRIDQLAEELGFERERIRGWAVAQAVLSAWWSIEDGGDVDDEWRAFIAFTEVLAKVRQV